MNQYTPNRWEIIEVVNNLSGEVIHKILGSWYGGFAGSDSWRLSSGIEKVIDKGDHWEIPQSSGSVYTCYKTSQGMSAYTSGVYDNYKSELEKSDLGTMKIIQITNLL